MGEIIDDFIVESAEALDSLDQKFIELEKNPGDTTLLNDIFRSVHTIKGAAGFLGFEQMVKVTHVTEDVLNKLRKGEMAVNPGIMDAILEATDLIKQILHNIKERNDKQEDIDPVVSHLSEILAGGASSDAPSVTPSAEEAPEAEGGAGPKEPPAVQAEEAKAEPEQPAEAKSGAKAEDKAKTEAKKTGAKAAQPAHAFEKEQSVRVDIERLDAIMNLAGELVLSRNRLIRLGSKVAELHEDTELSAHMDEATAQLNLVTTDLQLAVMKMRMQPVGKVFNKFPRMVRDLARKSNKEIELVISGEDTELDKTVIEEIGDPLVHLIRNSVDHGMETPDEREAAGKPRVGKIFLSAYQEGRNIIVEVAEDGRGIDPEKIKKTAIEKGLISAEEAANLSKRDALGLIFIPGFSTARQVSNISGRGVGMDVVKTNITRINGSISIDSEVGKGTKVTFRLPLTLAIIQALTVEAGKDVFAIPLANVVENLRVAADEVKSVEGREVINIRDRVYPVVRLGSLVEEDYEPVQSDWMYIVIIAIGERNFGLLVDKLHGQEEIVMKSMGEYLKGTDGIAGACITGDGNVILILDVAGLMESTKRMYVR